MINLEEAKKQFIKYTEGFDLENENIKRKQLHSLRVMAISEDIAKTLKLSKEEIDLATLIGLLHDIARFEQYTQFQTYNDLQSFDHGDYALKILEKDIRKYIKISQYDEIIKIAIKNHNKYQIEEGISEEDILFAKVIRDADKIDIIYEAVEMFWNGVESQINKTKISENVEAQFRNGKQIKREKNEVKGQNIDRVLGVIAFIFDINFKESFKILKEQDYINKIFDRFNFEDKETKDKIEDIRRIANEYINKKIKE